MKIVFAVTLILIALNFGAVADHHDPERPGAAGKLSPHAVPAECSGCCCGMMRGNQCDAKCERNGPSKLHRWLLGVDLGDFNPAAPAYYTQAKDRMIADTQSDVGTWVRQLLATPDAFLRVGEVKLTKDLYTNKELLRLYDPEQRGRLTANGLGRELKRAGARQVLGGAPVKGPDGSLDRYYAVRNVDHWLAAELAAVREHLAPEAGSSRRGGRF